MKKSEPNVGCNVISSFVFVRLFTDGREPEKLMAIVIDMTIATSCIAFIESSESFVTGGVTHSVSTAKKKDIDNALFTLCFTPTSSDFVHECGSVNSAFTRYTVYWNKAVEKEDH